MFNQSDMEKIKQVAEEFFQKATLNVSKIEASFDIGEIVNLDIKSDEPQILIGQQGQTLFEIQRLLRLIINKKLQKIAYLNLDINDYKKKKVEYLKETAKDLANEVAFTKTEKVLTPMSAYERRIIHAELSDRSDVITESHGEGLSRHIVIKPK